MSTVSGKHEIPVSEQSNAGIFHKCNIAYPGRSLEFLDQLQPLSNDHAGVEGRKLDIAIVGAGLGGLSAAVALARHGHHVRVLEQAQKLSEVGAGIQIPPNSMRHLSRWGVDQLWEGRVVEPDSITFRRWKDGAAIAYTPLKPDFTDRYNAPYLTIHRADLHTALYRRSLELGVEVLTDTKVVQYDAEAPSVTTERGDTFNAELIIAADGVKSTVYDALGHGTSNGAYPAGFAAYRATVDAEKLKAHPELTWLVEAPNLNLWIGEDKHVMTYTISSGSTFNMVLSHVDWTHPSTWTHETALQDMREHFKDWDPQTLAAVSFNTIATDRLCKIISMIDKTMKWPLYSMRPNRNWVSASAKLVMIGDAAHAMVPYMSQGAAMAVEDAAALAVAIQHACSNQTPIADALRTFETVRSLRACQMQQASLVNGKLWHLPDGEAQEARDAATRPEVEGKLFEVSANQWSDRATQQWTYGYDAEEEMMRAIREQSLWATDGCAVGWQRKREGSSKI